MTAVVVVNPGRRDGPAWRSVPEPGIDEHFSATKRCGERYPSELCGRSVLDSRRKSSITTRASVRVQSCSRLRHSSRKREWNDSTKPFSQGLAGVMQMVLILVSASQRWSALIGSATGCSGARNDYSGWQETISQIRNVSRSHA